MSSPAVWYLTAVTSGSGTVSGSLASFGIDNPQTSFRSMDDDELTFEVKTSVTAAPMFSFGDRISLFKTAAGTTTCWFIGTVSKTTVIGTGATEAFLYVVSGPWYQLKRTLWQVPCQQYNPITCQLIPILLSKIVLFQDPTTGAAITTGQQITNIIAYATTVGIAIAAGSVPGFVSVPLDETRDLTLSDAIRRCMQWTPDGVTWFDYSSGAPVFNAAQRASLSAVTLDLSLTNLVSAINLIERSDLVPAGVLFNYIGSAYCNVIVPTGCADPSTGIVNAGGPTLSQGKVQVVTITQDSAGIPTLPGSIIGSIDLQQLTATTSENPPVGLAGQFYLSLLTPTWDGSVTTHEQDCSGTLRPGKSLNLSNGQAAWASMSAQIQEVRESLYDGITTATFGTPGHLQPQNFATLIQMIRRRALVTTGLAAVNTGGTSNGTSCQKGIQPETQKLLNKIGGSNSATAAAIGNSGFNGVLNTCNVTACVGGSAVSLKLYCPPQ